LDAHNILLLIAGFFFLSFPLGISIAATIRVGNLVGAGEASRAKRAVRTHSICTHSQYLHALTASCTHSQYHSLQSHSLQSHSLHCAHCNRTHCNRAHCNRTHRIVLYGRQRSLS
jgi:hypothetical protein